MFILGSGPKFVSSAPFVINLFPSHRQRCFRITVTKPLCRISNLTAQSVEGNSSWRR